MLGAQEQFRPTHFLLNAQDTDTLPVPFHGVSVSLVAVSLLDVGQSQPSATNYR